MKNKLLIVLLPLLFISCDKKIYNTEVCNDLSMATFKGLPKESREFLKNCTSINITYTKKLCEVALQNLILGNSEEQLKKVHGNKVMSCFTLNDLKVFGKNSKD